MQIRHMQYHVGHCNSILRENNKEAVDWIDYLGSSNERVNKNPWI